MRTLIILLIGLCANNTMNITKINISKKNALSIGERIWHNECNGSINGLTSWNKGESFASLGIGHFIWFPKNCTSPYTQTFPDLIIFLKKHNVSLPKWLTQIKHCPWQSRTEFLKSKDSNQMITLRTLLSNTVDIQTKFIVQRLEASLPKLLKSVSQSKRPIIRKQFYRVATSPNGLYALIDYINFKGEGTNTKERYNNQGWGLLQVLEHMSTHTGTQDTLIAFSNAANSLLTQRVNNTPDNKNEKMFLPGWLNRIKTYTKNFS